MNIVNNMMPGASFGVLLQNETVNAKEINVGDKYEISGQAGAVGRNAKSKDSNFYQADSLTGIDIDVLVNELELLRVAMRQQAESPDNDLAVAEVGQALIAAKGADKGNVISHLREAGQWALGIASTIGTSVAASAIKSALNL